ncbi:DNA polymerase III subunit delta [Bacillus manliponensis]|uniref:DNA polymerase III subunit delta n=1 Tax=Bacillus manliponensis TaxID=574376 RepID=UPI00351484C6
MKKSVICFIFSSILLSSCSFQQSSVGEKKFIAEGDMMVEPMSVAEAQSIVPFSFQVPTFLPYEATDEIEATVRDIEKNKIVIDIKYEQKERNQAEYIELTIANFAYNFPIVVDQQLFQEEIQLKKNVIAYFKDRDDEEDFATLTWKEDKIEYQLLYRNVAEGSTEEVKQNLIYIAKNMEKRTSFS